MDKTPAVPSARPVRRLRPLQSVRLPRALQADRAWQHARDLPDGVRDPAFLALVQEIDGSPWHALGALQVLEDGEATFAAIDRVLATARTEILLETYILRDDRVGAKLSEALKAAVARGVRVSVLADALGSIGTTRAFWRSLEASGIAVRLFHPWWHSPLHAWRRDHRKIIVVDRATAFTGGMNIGNEYGSSLRGRSGPDADVFRDIFVQVDGPVALELASVFAEGWERAGGAALPDLKPVPRRPRGGMPAVDPSPGVLILDGGPQRGQPETIAVLAALVGAARQRLWIATPYFAPPDGGLRILEDAAGRGVDVRLLLPARCDVPIVRHAAHGAYTRLLRAGVRIFEYERAILHAKTMVSDDYLSVVGSANLDFRSLWFNAECNLLIADEPTATRFAALFATDLEDSHEIRLADWQARAMPHRLWDTMARGLRVLL
jgi:cardiolipin synthase A/B